MTIQLPRAQAEKLLASIKGRAAKYRNQKVEGYDADGNVITFDSKKEARRWGELLALQRQGLISQLQRQVTFVFGGDNRSVRYKSKKSVRYVVDFMYHDGRDLIYEDVKSPASKTHAYKIKWALMKYFFGIEVQEV
jgi:hypothetical protein